MKRTYIYVNKKLCRNRCDLSLQEKRALFLIISRIDFSSEEPKKVKVEKKFFFEMLNLKSKNNYSRYRKRLEGLTEKFWVDLELNRPEWQFNALEKVNWNSGQKFFEVWITDALMSFLVGPEEEMTELRLDAFFKLKRKHSLTLYMFNASAIDKKTGRGSISIEESDLLDLLGIKKGSYCKKIKSKDKE